RRLAGGGARLGEDREEDRGQYGDDSYYYKKFNESKAAAGSIAFHGGLLPWSGDMSPTLWTSGPRVPALTVAAACDCPAIFGAPSCTLKCGRATPACRGSHSVLIRLTTGGGVPPWMAEYMCRRQSSPILPHEAGSWGNVPGGRRKGLFNDVEH